MAEVLCTLRVVFRCSATLTEDLWCVLLTPGASYILPAAKGQFPKFYHQIVLCVAKVSVEVGTVDDGVTCEQPWILLWLTWLRQVGLNSSLGLVTRFGQGCPGIEYQLGGGRDFPHPSQTGLGRPVHGVPGLFSGGKAAGSWR